MWSSSLTVVSRSLSSVISLIWFYVLFFGCFWGPTENSIDMMQWHPNYDLDSFGFVVYTVFFCVEYFDDKQFVCGMALKLESLNCFDLHCRYDAFTLVAYISSFDGIPPNWYRFIHEIVILSLILV